MTESPPSPGVAHRRGIGYMPGIDGLRALAVTAVVVYHLGAGWLPGGYLGVDVFLVISGFLITSLLLAEQRATGRIDLRRFWLRRARRLLPAAFLMIGVVLVVMLLAHPGEVARLRGQVVAAMAYVINWHFIVADVPYFEQFGRPSVFLHLWSLAIEEQFYFVWPLVMALVLGAAMLRSRPVVLLAMVVAAGIVSTTLAWVMWQPYADPSRIYYGTDTRAVALLAGVALALGASAIPAAGRARPAGRWVLQGVGAVGLAGILLAMFSLGDLDERLYRGGFMMVAVASAALIAAASDGASPLGRAFAWAPLVWIGLRSYAIYLWHWPVIALTRPGQDVPFDGPALVALRVALMLALAVLSYRFVEVPFRRRGVRGVADAVGRWDARVGRRARLAAVSVLAAAVLALVATVALIPPGATNIPGLTAGASARPGPAAPAPQADAPPPGGTMLFVGDSVMLGARADLERAFGRGAVVDAAAGRTFTEGAAVVRGHLRRMPSDTTVVIHLGNNSFIDPADMEGLLRSLARSPRVYVLTVRVPLPWQNSVNETVRGLPERHGNVRVVEWSTASAGQGLLVDGAHMSDRGIRVYTETLRAALAGGPTAGAPDQQG